MVYSYGPDTDQQEVEDREAAGTFRPTVMYDPTNGTVSDGDLFLTIPAP